MAAADDADDEARAHEVVLARDAARVRAYRDGRYGDGLSGAPDVTPEDAARGVLDRLRADPAWAGAVPTEEEAVAGLTELFSGWSDGVDPRLRTLLGHLEQALPVALGGPPAGRPVVATLRRTPFFFARTVEFPEIEHAYLVLMHERFTHYTDLISRAVVASLPADVLHRPYEPEDVAAFVDARVRAVPDGTIYSFAEAAVSLALHRSDVRAGSLPVERERRVMTSFLWEATDLFVLGHECAHFEMSHRGPPRPALARLGAAHAVDRYWQELQADELGLSFASWSLHASREASTAVSSLGAWMFFAAWEAYELSAAILTAGSRAHGERDLAQRRAVRDLDAYPPLHERKARLFRTLKASGAADPAALTRLWWGFDIALQYLLDYTAAHAEVMAGRVGAAVVPSLSPTPPHGPGARA